VGVHPFSAYSVSHNNLRPETEEGELSPNGDFKEEHFCVFEDEAIDGTSKQNEGSTSRSPRVDLRIISSFQARIIQVQKMKVTREPRGLQRIVKMHLRLMKIPLAENLMVMRSLLMKIRMKKRMIWILIQRQKMTAEQR
jgi:hypothetical protein